MRTLRHALLLGAVLLIVVPSASAYTEYVSAGPGGPDYTTRGTVEGDQALELRRAADGNRDGTVTAAEADAWRQEAHRPFDAARDEACVARFDMFEAPGFRKYGIDWFDSHPVVGPVDGRPMTRLLYAKVLGEGIGVGTPITVHFDRRANLVELLKCVGAVDQDPFPAGRPDRIEVTGGWDSWDISGDIQPFRARALRELMGVDNAVIPQYWILADSASEVDLLHTQGLTYRNAVEMQGLQGWIVGHAYLLFGAGGALAALAAGAFLTEVGRWKLSALPLFTRIEKDEALGHERRDRLYTHIQQNPGQSFSDLRRALGMARGTLLHHLRVLEAQEYLKVHRDGFRTRFYLRGPRVEPEPYLSRTQRQLLDLVQANPGLTQRDLAGMLGLPHQSVLYHGRRLAAAGKVALKADGRRQRYFPQAPTA